MAELMSDPQVIAKREAFDRSKIKRGVRFRHARLIDDQRQPVVCVITKRYLSRSGQLIGVHYRFETAKANRMYADLQYFIDQCFGSWAD